MATRERLEIRESKDNRATRVLQEFKEIPVIQDQEGSVTSVGASLQ